MPASSSDTIRLRTHGLIEPMGSPRICHAASVIDGLLYVFGGSIVHDESHHTASSTGERYDPTANAWSPIAEMHTARSSLTAVALHIDTLEVEEEEPA